MLALTWQCIPSIDHPEAEKCFTNFVSGVWSHNIEGVTILPGDTGRVVSDQGEPCRILYVANPLIILKVSTKSYRVLLLCRESMSSSFNLSM